MHRVCRRLTHRNLLGVVLLVTVPFVFYIQTGTRYSMRSESRRTVPSSERESLAVMQTTEVSFANFMNTNENDVVKSKISEAIKYGTSPEIIFSTDNSDQVKYYNYVDDFLTNWNKYPMSEEAASRVEAVRETAMRLKNRQLFTEALTTSQRDVVFDLLSSFDSLAKAEGIRYFAYGGTLLGSFRHHDLIAWDDDVDIIIDDNDRTKLQDAVKRSTMSFILSTLSPDHFKLHNRYGQFTNLYHDWTYPYIDISFYKQNDTHLWDMAVTYGRWWAYDVKDIFPLHDRPLGPLMLPSPRDTLKYLRDTYDLSMCSEGYYSHQLEMVVRCRHIKTDCRLLPYAFVHRSKPMRGAGVNETLIRNGTILHSHIIMEADYTAQINDPYTLNLT